MKAKEFLESKQIKDTLFVNNESVNDGLSSLLDEYLQNQIPEIIEEFKKEKKELSEFLIHLTTLIKYQEITIENNMNFDYSEAIYSKVIHLIEKYGKV